MCGSITVKMKGYDEKHRSHYLVLINDFYDVLLGVLFVPR